MGRTAARRSIVRPPGPPSRYAREVDILSAARALRHPAVFRSPEDFGALAVSARAIIGDGFTAALVASDGAIDWLCLPRFDSPSVFARVLDTHRGGSMAIRPATFPFDSVQRYDTDTNVLETLFTAPGKGAVRVLDLMPWADDPRATIHEVHRRIDCPEGDVEVEILFDPRFDYGRDVPRVTPGEHGVLAEGANGELLSLSVGEKVTWTMLPGGGARATLRMHANMQVWCVLAWGRKDIAHIRSHRPFEHLRSTRRKWRAWASQLEYDGPFRHDVLRSALTLKLLMYAPTGAVVAAPTTSLPEWPGGQRNWDYRYAWARDSAMAIRAANLIGYRAEARDFYHFLRDAVDLGAGLQLMYTVDGRAVPEEETLGHLRGALGASPVRIGNGARDQLQLDTTGAVVDAANLFERFGGSLTLRAWDTLSAILMRAEDSWQLPDHGIWEPRTGKRHHVHSKLMNWLAMDRGAQLALSFGRSDLCEQWTNVANTIHADICEKAMIGNGDGHFVSVYGGGEEDADATLLLLAVHGFLPDSDERLRRTVRFVRDRLGAGPFLYRYKEHDGVGGPEGAFLLCGFWLAEALALQGDLDDALDVFVAHAEASNHVGLLAEEIDPTSKHLLGNIPQAFSHLGLINAALRIDRALRLRDEGSTASPHLVGPLPRKV